MAQLLIRGHATRGKEVVEILEMLGGINNHGYDCYVTDNVYYINKSGKIDWYVPRYDSSSIIFTLDAFLEKFPYKIGDKVNSPCKGCIKTITSMKWDTYLNTVTYKLDNRIYTNIDQLKVVNDLQPHKEETMEETIIDIIKESKDRYRIKVNYQFDIEVDEGEYYVVRRKPQYPKTFEDCCRTVNANPYIRLIYGLSDEQRYSYDVDNLRHYENIRELLICRDAYWKIAGDWKPNWEDTSQSKHSIWFNNEGICIKSNRISYAVQHILTFPTKEMRDAFYENFKDLIEDCKGLL